MYQKLVKQLAMVHKKFKIKSNLDFDDIQAGPMFCWTCFFVGLSYARLIRIAFATTNRLDKLMPMAASQGGT